MVKSRGSRVPYVGSAFPTLQLSFEELMAALDRDTELCRLISKGILTTNGVEFLDDKRKKALWAVSYAMHVHGSLCSLIMLY